MEYITKGQFFLNILQIFLRKKQGSDNGLRLTVVCIFTLMQAYTFISITNPSQWDGRRGQGF